MPYIIYNRFTKEYVTNGYGDSTDISDGRLFRQKNHAHSCSEYQASIHELIPLLLVEDTSEDRVRKGTWLTEQEYIEKYDGEIFWDGETIESWGYAGSDRFRLHRPDPSITHTFQVKDGKVYQVMMKECRWRQSQGRGDEAVSLQVYPQKQERLR